MNLLLLPEQAFSAGDAVITGVRALHIHSVLRASPGDRIRAGFLNGRTGTVLLKETTREKAILSDPVFPNECPPPPPLTLAVALPRPQSFKKTLHFIASSGIAKAVFFHSARVEKSYWKSDVLQPEQVRAGVIEGLEQGFCTRVPELVFVRSFGEFLERMDEFAPAGTERIAAHPVPGQEPYRSSGKEVFLAIGPEGGFIPRELALLEEKHFRKQGFGNYILRVEFACAFIAGQILR